MSKKVVVSIYNGEVSGWEIPEGVTVEIRDYDCPEDWGDMKVDEEGDRYQEIILASESK